MLNKTKAKASAAEKTRTFRAELDKQARPLAAAMHDLKLPPAACFAVLVSLTH